MTRRSFSSPVSFSTLFLKYLRCFSFFFTSFNLYPFNYLKVLARKPLEPLNFDDAANLSNCSFELPTNTLKQICNNVEEENHSELSLCEMSDHFPELVNDNFEIKRRKYVGRSHSAPTVGLVSIFYLVWFNIF